MPLPNAISYPSPEKEDERAVTHRTSIPQLVLLTRQNLPQNPPHDLATPRLGQVRHREHSLGRGERSNALAHLQDEVFLDLIGMVEAVLERDEGVDRLARELVVDAYDGGFGYGVCFAVLVYVLCRDGKGTYGAR